MRYILALALVALLLGVTGRSDARVIRYDPGGLIAAYVTRIATETRPVQIRGYCASSCTMYLAARDVCVYPNARLVFHGPSSYGFPLPPALFERWSRVMAWHYPPAIARWFMERARYGQYTLRGSEVARHGVALC